MKERKEAAVVVATERRQTGSDRLLISMKIGDNFDEGGGRYRPGWSDAAISKELSVPIEWVRGEREHLYPGTEGDDPRVGEMVAALNAAQEMLGAFDQTLKNLGNSVASTEKLLAEVTDAQRQQRIEMTRVQEERRRLDIVMRRLTGQEEKAAG